MRRPGAKLKFAIPAFTQRARKDEAPIDSRNVA